MIVVRHFMFLWLLTACCVLPSGAFAGEPDASTEPRVDIDREKPDDERPRTLRFLRENQGFLRAQLDQLRTKITWTHGDARALSDHQRWLQGLGRDRMAAVDSLDVEQQRLARRTLLERIEQLGAIEEQLDRIETLLLAQDTRLDGIESDYVRRQETAVALLATGLPLADAQAIRVDTVDGGAHRVALDEATRAALRSGAVAELLHDFFEPRSTTLILSVEADDGSIREVGRVRVDPARDRLTFVQVDLTTQPNESGELARVVWER